MVEVIANSGHPDAASDLGLHCLSVTHLGVFSLQWVIFMKHSKCIRGETIHRIHGASLFSGHDSVHDSFSQSFDTAWFTQV